MNSRELKQALELLAFEFGVAVPDVIYGMGRGSRCYAPKFGSKRSRIVLGRGDFHELADTVMHEFTHAVQFARVGRHQHDYKFFETLRAVVKAWTGDAKQYDWSKEYWTVWKYAFEAGLTQKKWFKHERREEAQHERLKMQSSQTIQFEPMMANVMAESKRPPGPIRAGTRVKWTCRSHEQVGVVVSAYAGRRARVKSDDGRQWYVPQSWLVPDE